MGPLEEKEANQNLYAIKIIAKYFNAEEKKTLLTSLFYLKLYYGSEIWHLPGRSILQNKKLKFASANGLRSLDRSMTIYNNHTQIHNNSKRALPDQVINYKMALTNYFTHVNQNKNLSISKSESKNTTRELRHQTKLWHWKEHYAEQICTPKPQMNLTQNVKNRWSWLLKQITQKGGCSSRSYWSSNWECLKFK